MELEWLAMRMMEGSFLRTIPAFSIVQVVIIMKISGLSS